MEAMVWNETIRLKSSEFFIGDLIYVRLLCHQTWPLKEDEDWY